MSVNSESGRLWGHGPNSPGPRAQAATGSRGVSLRHLLLEAMLLYIKGSAEALRREVRPAMAATIVVFSSYVFSWLWFRLFLCSD